MTAIWGKAAGMRFSGRKPVLIAIASQTVAVAGLLAVIQGYHSYTGGDLQTWIKVTLACVLAGGTSALFRADIRWTAFLTALPFLFYLGLTLSLPAWVPFLLLAALIVVFRNVWSDRVPLYLTNQETLAHLGARLGPTDKAVRFIDLGCGTGTVPIALSAMNSNPDSRFDGVESAPFLFLIARLRALMTRDRRITIRYQSIWDADLASYDTAYAFLSPHPMAKLFDQVWRTMPAGATFISNSFDVPGHPPDETIPLSTGRATKLMLWYIRDTPK